MVSTILVAIEDSGRRQGISNVLINQGYHIIEASSGYHALDLLRRRSNIAVALVDLKMSDINGINFIETLRFAGVRSPIIIVSTTDDGHDLTRAIESGANDFILYPFSDIRLMITIKNTIQKASIERELQSMHRFIGGRLHFSDLIAHSIAMQTAIMVAKKIVSHNNNVLITGETGTGRQRMASIMHRESSYKNAPLQQLQCRLPLGQEDLMASWKSNLEKILANFTHGTLVFNNIEDLPQDAQEFLYKCLQKFIQDKGPHIRLNATATATIDEIVDEGRFNKKLYKIFAEQILTLPPLRNRREDIADIAKTLLVHILFETGNTHISGLSNSAIVFLSQYNWPGNIIELERILFRAVLLSSGPLISITDFPQLLRGEIHEPTRIQENSDSDTKHILFDENGHVYPLEDIERVVINAAMKHYHGRISEVARRLKIGRSTLYRKLEELKIEI